MFNFPKHAMVNVPVTKTLDGQCLVSVRINNQDDITRLRWFYGRRLFNFECESGLISDVKLVHSLKGARVRIRVVNADMFRRHEIIDALQTLQPVFILDADVNLIRHINFLTSLNFQVHLNASAAVQEEDALLRAVDFYLHNPLLTIPIEPFHSLLSTVSQKQGYCLWDTESENFITNFYVSDSGRISLSQRWAENGLYYGTLENSWESIVDSKIYQRLVAFNIELFQRKRLCIFCEHFDLCRGFLRAIDPEWPCRVWQQVFKTLYAEVRKAKKLQEEIK